MLDFFKSFIVFTLKSSIFFFLLAHYSTWFIEAFLTCYCDKFGGLSIEQAQILCLITGIYLFFIFIFCVMSPVVYAIKHFPI